MVALRQALILLLLAMIPAIAVGLLPRHSPSLKRPLLNDELTYDQVKALGPLVLWIDARSVAKYNAGHVPEAICLNEDKWNEQLTTFIEEWTPEQKVIVYCDSEECGASRAVAQRLKNEVGVTDVYVLQGGWQAWQQRQ